MQLDAFTTGGTSPPRPDLLVSGGGTIYLLFATSPRGETWIDEHIPEDAQWFAGGVAVEHRIAPRRAPNGGSRVAVAGDRALHEDRA